MNEEDFKKLGEHLSLVRPIIDDFCRRYGFEYVNPLSLGRYPRIRIQKISEINRWFDLWMGLDKDGKRFEQHFEDVPYDLSAGADVTFPDDTKYGYRYQKGYECFSGKPFREMPTILQGELDQNLKIIEKWTLETLKKEGKKVQLG